jgi:hypothetical protein
MVRPISIHTRKRWHHHARFCIGHEMRQIANALLICAQRVRPALLPQLQLVLCSCAVCAYGAHAALAGLPWLPPKS